MKRIVNSQQGINIDLRDIKSLWPAYYGFIDHGILYYMVEYRDRLDVNTYTFIAYGCNFIHGKKYNSVHRALREAALFLDVFVFDDYEEFLRWLKENV